MKNNELFNYSPVISFLYLEKGRVEENLLYILIDIANIRSVKVINALKDYFVNGLDRASVCTANNISKSQLSVKIRQLEKLNKKILNIFLWYLNDNNNFI